MAEAIPAGQKECRLVKERGRYWLVVPYPVQCDIEAPSGDDVVALDPGVRTFLRAIRADGAPGSGPGAGPTLAWLFRAYPPSMGMSRRQWRAGRLHRTREEVREARVDVLGCCFGTAETGACSAIPAGEAETPTQSGSGGREW